MTRIAYHFAFINMAMVNKAIIDLLCIKIGGNLLVIDFDNFNFIDYRKEIFNIFVLLIAMVLFILESRIGDAQKTNK